MASRHCSECGESLVGKPASAKTCSATCRSARSRRLRRLQKERASLPEHQKELSDRVRGDIVDIAQDVIQDELKPFVREALTEDVLASIHSMVQLTPQVITNLTSDLADENAKVRQKAGELILKYTVGHPALVQPPDQDTTQPIQINFALPRPEEQPVELVEAEVEVVDEPSDTRQCDACGSDKPESEFVEASDRCLDCFNAQQKQAQDILDRTS